MNDHKCECCDSTTDLVLVPLCKTHFREALAGAAVRPCKHPNAKEIPTECLVRCPDCGFTFTEVQMANREIPSVAVREGRDPLRHILQAQRKPK
jgi:hypothetical protein